MLPSVSLLIAILPGLEEARTEGPSFSDAGLLSGMLSTEGHSAMAGTLVCYVGIHGAGALA